MLSPLAFLSSNVMVTPAWLQPASIVQRIGPSTVVSSRQAGLMASLLSPARLGRLAESETYDAINAYPLMEYMAELKRSVFTNGSPDAGRRQLHRVYLQRLDALLSPPASPAAAGGGGGGAARFVPFVSAPNVVQSDLPALARAQLREILRDARAFAATASPAARAHWLDVADRVTEILNPK
jgi:hypothetical protein